MHDTSLLHSGNHEHVHHCKDGLHDGVYAACTAAVSSALYIQETEDAYLVLAVDAYLMTLVLKPTALVFSTVAAGTGGALYPAHETAEISTEGKFSSFLYLYDPDVASHLVPDMAAYGTSADIRVQLDLGGPRLYREVPVPV